MKTILFLTILFAAFSPVADKDEQAAGELQRRIAPHYSVCFHKTGGDMDSYSFETKGRTLHISANNANSMCVAFGRYLKECCNAEVSWFSDEPVSLPKIQPRAEATSGRALTKRRFFFNYCTYGYTMPYWKWENWERMIDWMALNGINLSFAITGQESVWYKVWSSLGLSHEEIMDYFTGPAHLPWHRMNNIDRFQGNPPQGWMDGQVELQKKIVERERSLGIVPVIQVFSGHTPAALKNHYPDAAIHPLHPDRERGWGGFDARRHDSYFLETTDPLFSKIQKLYMEESARMFGSDHVYGADPFNEVDSPDWSPEFLASVSKGIYDTMKEADPEAVWIQMAWLFYHDSKHWTPERVKAYLRAVPEGGLTLLDYYCDKKELWKLTDRFHGQPYIWCMLGNFGGNTNLVGNYAGIKAKLDTVFRDGGSNFSGVGSTLEGLDCNIWLYEYLFERAWDAPASTSDDVADRTLGREDSHWRKAWSDMTTKIYTHHVRGSYQGSSLNVRPRFRERCGSNKHSEYAPEDMIAVWKEMIAAKPSGTDAYRYWMVNAGRQTLADLFDSLALSFYEASLRGDAAEAARLAPRMLELARDMDVLLAQHPAFSFAKWVNSARAWGKDGKEADYYETNARTLLTTWGERNISLVDYANRNWSGLVGEYCIPRWKAYTDYIVSELEAGRPIDPASGSFAGMDAALADFEYAYATSHAPVCEAERVSDIRKLCKTLFEKYFDE